MRVSPRLIGMTVQGVALGMLLFFAIVVLLGFDGDARLFRYQGY